MAKRISELSFYPWIGANYISYSTLLREMLWKSDMIITSKVLGKKCSHVIRSLFLICSCCVQYIDDNPGYHLLHAWAAPDTAALYVLCTCLCLTVTRHTKSYHSVHVTARKWYTEELSIPTSTIQPWISEPGFEPAGLQSDNQTVHYRLLPDRGGWPPRIWGQLCKLHC